MKEFSFHVLIEADDEKRRIRRGDNLLAGELIYTMYEVTGAAVHTVGLLCVVAFSGVA